MNLFAVIHEINYLCVFKPPINPRRAFAGSALILPRRSIKFDINIKFGDRSNCFQYPIFKTMFKVNELHLRSRVNLGEFYRGSGCSCLITNYQPFNIINQSFIDKVYVRMEEYPYEKYLKEVLQNKSEKIDIKDIRDLAGGTRRRDTRL